MDANTTTTVEISLEALSEALMKATDDLTAVHGTIELARTNLDAIGEHAADQIIDAATRAVDHLGHVEEALRDLVEGLEERN